MSKGYDKIFTYEEIQKCESPDLKFEAQQVNGDVVFPGIVLHGPS